MLQNIAKNKNFRLNVKENNRNKLAKISSIHFSTTNDKIWEKNSMGFRAETNFKPELKMRLSEINVSGNQI